MNKNELSLIKQAILNEIEGYEFYKIAAHEAKTTDTKQSFLNLANEEMMHVEWLKELFMKMTDSSSESFTLSEIADPPSPKVFDLKHVNKTNAGLAMSVFSISMQMEQASVAFYTKAMETTENEQAKKMYGKLITWEKVHLEQFSREYEALTEDWWSDQGFAPF